jgi:hypothetical protein
VESVSRTVELREDGLHYDIGMQFGGHPLQDHLAADLARIA